MSGGDVTGHHHSSFEALRHVDDDGNEYWLARELMPVLEYGTWRSFRAVIAKAMTAAEQVKQPANDHFAEVGKMVRIGSGTQREVEDFRLSRYALSTAGMAEGTGAGSESSPASIFLHTIILPTSAKCLDSAVSTAGADTAADAAGRR